MNSAVIFCGGPIASYDYLRAMDFQGKFIICADGGLKHLCELGISADVIVGDNDSWTGEYPKSAEVIKLPMEKDFTDTNFCVDYLIERGYKNIEIIGGMGGRADHEFSHYCLIDYALSKGARIRMTDEHNEIWMENKPFTLFRGNKKYVSFFPFGGTVEGLSVRGLKYSADNIRLECDKVQASSNEFSDCEAAEIDFKSGTLLVMLCDD